MNARKVLSFVLCSSAFTKRNISSLGLVGFFFLVYILAGGKIDTAIPSPSKLGAFGSGESDNPLGMIKGSKDDSSEVLGINDTKDRAEKEGVALSKGRVFSDEERDTLASEKIDHSGLVDGSAANRPSRTEQRAIQRTTKKEVDPLLAIEERLHKIGKTPQ